MKMPNIGGFGGHHISDHMHIGENIKSFTKLVKHEKSKKDLEFEAFAEYLDVFKGDTDDQ